MGLVGQNRFTGTPFTCRFNTLTWALNISRFTEHLISQECFRECYTVRGNISYTHMYMYALIEGCMKFDSKKI